MNSQRRRNKSLSIRLTSAQKDYVLTESRKKGITVSDLILTSVFDNHKNSDKDVFTLIGYVTMMQKKIDSLHKQISPEELKDIMTNQAKIYKSVCDIAKNNNR